MHWSIKDLDNEKDIFFFVQKINFLKQILNLLRIAAWEKKSVREISNSSHKSLAIKWFFKEHEDLKK